jgi:hypothetical protein
MLRTELRSSNQVRDEQRSIAIRSALQQGAFMCVLLNRDGRLLDDIQKTYNASCLKTESQSKEAEIRCNAFKKNIETRLGAQEVTLGLYSDSLVEAGAIYTLDNVTPEVPVKRQQLLARNKSNLGLYLDTYWSHFSGYLSNRKITQTEWLAGCKAVPIK